MGLSKQPRRGFVRNVCGFAAGARKTSLRNTAASMFSASNHTKLCNETSNTVLGIHLQRGSFRISFASCFTLFPLVLIP